MKNLGQFVPLESPVYGVCDSPTSDDMFSNGFSDAQKSMSEAQKPFSPPLMKIKIADSTPYLHSAMGGGASLSVIQRDGQFVELKKYHIKADFYGPLDSRYCHCRNNTRSSFIRIYSAGFGEESLPFLIYEEYDELFKHYIEVQNNV